MSQRTCRQFCLGSTAVLALGGAIVAQIPPHAVPLNPTTGFAYPQMARSGQAVHAIGEASTGPSTWNVIYGHSRDGGRTWPVRDVVLGSVHGVGNLAVDGDEVHVGILTSSYEPHVLSSHDGGVTWQAPVALHSQTFGTTTPKPILHVAGSVVNAFWFHETTAMVVYTKRSVDGGVTWPGAVTRLDVGVPASSAAWDQVDAELQVLADGSALHVVWNRGLGVSPAQRVYRTVHQRSLDGGATWQSTGSVIASTTRAPLSGDPVQPAAIAGGAVFVASGETLLRTLDQGASWHVVPGHGLGTVAWRIFGIAASGSSVLAFARANTQLSVNASADSGTTWRAVPYLIPLALSSALLGHVVDDAMLISVIYPSWTFVRPTIIQSDDFANSWRVLTGEGTVYHADRSGAIALGYDATVPGLMAWVLEGHTSLGQGSAGTVNQVPSLRGRGLAGLGRTFDLSVEGARANAPVGYFADFGPTTALAVGPATLYLTQPIGPFSLMTSAVGEATFAVTVPVDPSFAGLRIATQAFVLDPGVPAGFAATAAVESWLR